MAFTALAAGVSGLQAFSEGVGVIADNITNVNTIGYKETRSRFSTLVTETAAISSYSPGGVRAFAETKISNQGLLQPSNSATDLAVDGAGFFVTKIAEDAQSNGEFVFTRAGAFGQDDQGFLRNTAGVYLMGWPVDVTGAIPTNQNDLSELQPINISNLNGLAQPTENVRVRANLQASTQINATYTGVGDLATGTAIADFETNVEVFDSLGRGHTMVMSVAKTGTNTWAVEVFASDPSELDLAQHPDGIVLSGSLVFNKDGRSTKGHLAIRPRHRQQSILTQRMFRSPKTALSASILVRTGSQTASPSLTVSQRQFHPVLMARALVT